MSRSAKWLLAFGLFLIVAVLGFTAWQQVRHTNILSTFDWCARAIKAEQLAPGRQASSCGALLEKQVGAIAINSHIYAAGYTITLLAMILLLVAKGNLSFSISKTGVSANISKNEAEKAAEHVREGAEEAEQEIKDAAV